MAERGQLNGKVNNIIISNTSSINNKNLRVDRQKSSLQRGGVYKKPRLH